MKLGKGAKVGLGFLCLTPPIYVVVAAIYIVRIAMSAVNGHGHVDVQHMVRVVFPIHLAASLFIMGVVGLLAYLIFAKNIVPKQHQVAWVLGLFFGNAIAIPVFYFVYLLPDKPATGVAPGHEPDKQAY